MGKKTTQKQTSQSGNYSYEPIRTAYTPAIEQGNTAGQGLMALLGFGDSAAQEAGLRRYLDSSGYNFTLDQGNRAITGTSAGRGLLNSGSTARALSDYGQKTAQSYFDQYLTRLAQQQSAGLGAGGLMANAGQWNKSEGSSTQSGGLGGILGTALSLAAAIPTGGASLAAGLGGAGAGIGGLAGMFSDRRLKKNVQKLETLSDGLGLYSYEYLWSNEARVGVMADEVATLRPWALGDTILGYKTVNYERL